MGDIRPIKPVLLIIGAFASEEQTLEWAKEKTAGCFGTIFLESENFRFDRFTDYYEREMGAVLLKRFWAFEKLIDPSALSDIKCRCNDLEETVRAKDRLSSDKTSIPRPLNLDPGYIDLGKLILASTKDHAHRIYLRDGIFAETTLMYTQKKWQALPWTYPDYRSEAYHRFFCLCRDYLKSMQSGDPA